MAGLGAWVGLVGRGWDGVRLKVWLGGIGCDTWLVVVFACILLLKLLGI